MTGVDTGKCGSLVGCIQDSNFFTRQGAYITYPQEDHLANKAASTLQVVDDSDRGVVS